MDNVRTSEALNRRNSAFDNGLRPSGFSDFVGQAKIRDRLLLAVQAAKERGFLHRRKMMRHGNDGDAPVRFGGHGE